MAERYGDGRKMQSPFLSHMDQALDQARRAGERGEVPVGAVVVAPDGRVLAARGNETRALNDPSAHAEVQAIRAACAEMGAERLAGCDLYVTLEPCAACAGVIAAARIARLYFGAADPKSGGVMHGARVFAHPQAHHVPEIYDGIGAAAAETLLRDFFRARR